MAFGNKCNESSPESYETEDGQTRFCWTEWQKSYSLQAFYWGYIVFQIPGAGLAEKVGSKLVLGVSMFLTSVFTLFNPIAANSNFGWFLVLRIATGVASGVTFPCFPSMINL